MKSHGEIDGGDARRNTKHSRRKRNEKRLGGRGLSLEAFANAKSVPFGYNPAIIEKKREFYKNAKFISKFRKSLKQQEQSDSHLPIAPKYKYFVHSLDGDDENKNETKLRRSNKKRKNTLQSLREEFEKKQEEEQKTRMEREAILQAKQEERARAEAKQKELKGKMYKKTRSGQPVMKYRIEHLLEGITQGSSK